MPMPEAAVHKDDGAVLGKDQVGPSGDFLRVKAVAEATGMEDSPYRAFGLGVLAPNTSHDT